MQYSVEWWWRGSGSIYSEIIARSWADKGFAQRLIAHPRDVLAEHGIRIPEDLEVKVMPGQLDVVLRHSEQVPVLELPLPNKPAELDQASLDKVLKYWPCWPIF